MKKILWLTAAFVLLFTPSLVLPNGGEEGWTPPDNAKVSPPPYMGQLTFTWVGGNCKAPDGADSADCVYVRGCLPQVGKNTAQLCFDGELVESAVPFESFSTHDSQDLTRTCDDSGKCDRGRYLVKRDPPFIYFYQIMGAHKLNYYDDRTVIKVDVILMKLE